MDAPLVRNIAVSAILLIACTFACEDHSAGAKVFLREKCRECHTMNGTGGAVGPNLTAVGARRDRAYIRLQIIDPSSHNPNTAMPSFKDMPEQDLNALVEYLARKK